MRALICVAALLGGSCWIARVPLDGTAAEAAFLVGAALLTVATLLLGLQAAPTAPAWLQAVVGLGSVCLGVSVLATLRAEAAQAAVVDAVAGTVAVLLGGYLANRWWRPVRRRRPVARQPRPGGAHAGR